MRCKATGSHSPRGTSWASSQARKPIVPEHTSGPLGAILLHQRSKLRTTSEFQKGEKRAFPKEVSITVGSIAEPTFDVLVFCVAEQKHIPHTPDEMALSNILSRSLKNTKLSPETTSLAQVNGYRVLPSFPNGTTQVLNRTSHHTQRRKTGPNQTSL